MAIGTHRRLGAALAGLFLSAATLAAMPMAAAQGFSAVVHPSNPVSNLSLAGLRALFAGTVHPLAQPGQDRTGGPRQRGPPPTYS